MKRFGSIFLVGLLLSAQWGCSIRSYKSSYAYPGPTSAKNNPQVANPNDWTNLFSLRESDTVIVKLKNAAELRGKFKNATEQFIVVLDTKKEEKRAERANVHRVLRAVHDSTLNGVLMGLGIGFFSGFAGEGLIYHVAGNATGFPDAYSLGAGVFGMGVGAAAGALTDAALKKTVLVYEAQ